MSTKIYLRIPFVITQEIGNVGKEWHVAPFLNNSMERSLWMNAGVLVAASSN
jgi:hypothetical protein